MLFRDRICKVMKDNGLDGGLLQDTTTMRGKTFRKTVENGLNSDGQGALSTGVKARLKNILKTLSRESESETR